MRFIVQFLFIILLSACGTVSKILPDDRREEYRSSEALPDLEVPPDLTSAAENQSMNIPGETEASLAQYQQQQAQRNNPASAVQQTVVNDDNFVVVNGSSTEIWPELKQFFAEKGYSFNLDDSDMGVLGTDWLTSSNSASRIRYKIFSEPGAEPGMLVLYISNNIQQNTNGTWADAGKDPAAERLITGELNLYLGNRPATATSSQGVFSPVSASSSSARIEYTNDGTILYLPNEFTYAWVETEKAIQRAGLVINKSNQSNGVYTVAYYDAPQEVEKKGIVSRLAFWRKDNDDGAEGQLYNLSLTGAGNVTELIVLNENGEWVDNNAAEQIIQMLRQQYGG